MDETKLLNYLKGESDVEECLEVEAWYHASAEHKKQLDQLYYMLFVGERKVAMDGVDTENSLSVLKDRIKHKESEKKSVHRIRVSKWKRYAMPLAAFLCGLLVSEEEGILLKPGQMLSVDTRTMQPMLTEASRPGDVLLWINGKLKFEQATLQEIVQCLEKHFDVHFIISDAQLQKDRFTCTFSTDDDIRQILSILALTKRFDYKCEDNNIILTPKTNR